MQEILGFMSYQNKASFFPVNMNCNGKISNKVRFRVSQNAKINCLLTFTFFLPPSVGWQKWKDDPRTGKNNWLDEKGCRESPKRK